MGENQGGVIVSRDSVSEELIRIIRDRNAYSVLKVQAGQYAYDNESQLDRLYNSVFDNVQ